MSEDSRAERLRRRRGAARERADRADGDDPAASEASETDEPSETGERNEPEGGDPTTASADDTSVKEERVGTYMYLPAAQKKEMERVYGLLSTQYEYEYDEEFEKNRHFYPLLVRYGLDELDGSDPAALRERLDDVGER